MPSRPETNRERWQCVYDLSEKVLLEIDESRAKDENTHFESIYTYFEQRFGHLLMIAQDALGDEELIAMVNG